MPSTAVTLPKVRARPIVSMAVEPDWFVLVKKASHPQPYQIMSGGVSGSDLIAIRITLRRRPKVDRQGDSGVKTRPQRHICSPILPDMGGPIQAMSTSIRVCTPFWNLGT